MNFENKILSLFDHGRRSAVYVAGYQNARAQAASIAAEADRLIAEMAVENAELRERLAAKDEELERVRALPDRWLRALAEETNEMIEGRGSSEAAETLHYCVKQLQAALASPAAEPEQRLKEGYGIYSVNGELLTVHLGHSSPEYEAMCLPLKVRPVRIVEEQNAACRAEPNYSAIGAAIEEAIDDLCPKYTQDNRPHPHDTDNPDYTRLHLVDFKEVARRALAAARPAPLAEPEQQAEPVAAPAGYFCEPYLNKPGLFEQVFNGFDDPDVIPLYRDPAGTIAALERENAELRETLAAIRALDITELRDLLLILRRKIGGAMWSLDDEEEELAVRTEKAIDAIEALAAHRKQGGELMGNYKLVPFEPTPEMIEAAEEAHMPFGDMDLAIRMAILAAPAVQGEPVAYAVFTDNGNIRIWSSNPVQAETMRQKYGDQVRPLYTAPQPAEQQPAPDVAALVEALEMACEHLPLGSHALELAREALAAHRKGGSDNEQVHGSTD